MTTASVRSSPAGLYVLTGGLIAGTFDIVYACTFWAIRAHVAPTRIFQSVATGVLGPASYEGGAATAALGLAFHFFNAITMSVIYWLVSRRLTFLQQRPLLFGPIYGIIIYLVMNYVVIPLSYARRGPDEVVWVGLSVLVHMFLIGTPMALATARASRA